MIVILIISLVILTIRNIFILMIIVVSLIRFDQDDDQDDLSIIIIVIGSPTELSFDRCYWRGRRKDGPIVIKNLFFIQFRIRQKNNDLTLAARPSFDIP